MRIFSTLLLISIPLFVVCDFLWLGVIAHDLYARELPQLASHVRPVPAFIFYGMFLSCFTYFVTSRCVSGPLSAAMRDGGLFGFCVYASYELTNLAVLEIWSTTIVYIDIVWGTVLCGFVAVATVYIYQKFFVVGVHPQHGTLSS